MTPDSSTGSGTASSRRGLGVGGAALFGGTLAANVLAYGYFLVLSRYLSEADLGAIGTIVNLSLIATVPALGLQLVAARIVARAHADGDEAALSEADGRVIRLGVEIGVVTAVLLAVLSPLVARLLHLDVASVLVLAVAAAMISVTYAVQGIMQGEERFGALAVVYAVTGATRLASAVLAVVLGQGVLGAVALFTIGWGVTAGIGLLLLPRHQRALSRSSTRDIGRQVVQAVVSTSGLLVLSSFDVLLARHHLTLDQSGSYTIGALFEKAGFWGPAFLSTLFYPRMAVAASRRKAIVTALAVTVAVGAAGVLLTLALGDLLVRVAGGAAYAGLAGDIWLFAAFGVTLALVQVLVYAGLAVGDVRLGVVCWVVVGVDVVLIALRHASIVDIVTTLLVSALALVAVGLLLNLRDHRAVPDEPNLPPTPVQDAPPPA